MILPAAAASLLAFGLTPLVSRLAVLAGAIDMPGHRKVHSRPIPRLGGLAVVTAIAAVWAVTGILAATGLPTELSIGLGFGLLPILVISVIDDIRPIAASRKLAAHICGAAIAVGCGVSLAPDVHLFDVPIHIGAIAAPLSVLWLVAVTNAFNIIDGLDGLSAGLALISALSMAAVFSVVGQPVMAGATLVLAGALAGFLPYNVHPARLFLGDSGATAIGFCLAAFALKGGSTLSTGFAAVVPVFILGLPIADTVIAMARRTIRRMESRAGGVFVPDNNHIHHRLLALGIDHPKAVLILYGAGLVFAGVAFVSMFLKARHAALFILGVFAAGFIGLHRLGYDEFAFIRRGTMLRVYDRPVFRKSMFVVFIDLAMTFLAAYVAVGLKLDAWAPQDTRMLVMDLGVTFAPITALVFWRTGMYRGSWRVAGVTDLARAVRATMLVTLTGGVVHYLVSTVELPLSVFIIYGLISLLLVTASRASYVLLRYSHRRASNQGTPVLVYGAGRRGVAAIRELLDNPDAGLMPIGFVDDDQSKHAKTVKGLPVLGGSRDLDQLIAQHGAKALLVATTTIRPEALETAAAACERAGINVFRLNVEFERLSSHSDVDDEIHPTLVSSPLDAPLVETLSALTVLRPLGPAAFRESEPCRRCGSSNVHRSKARHVLERVRKPRTLRRLYRCRDCGWRGWLFPLEAAAPLADAGSTDLSDLDTPWENPMAIASSYSHRR